MHSLTLLTILPSMCFFFLASICLADRMPDAKHQLQNPLVVGIPQATGDASPPSFGGGTDRSADEFDVDQRETHCQLLIRSRRYFQAERTWTGQQIVEAICCVFIPPLAVLVHGGSDMLLHLVINIVLWICGWVPGAIHAFWYCFYHD